LAQFADGRAYSCQAVAKIYPHVKRARAKMVLENIQREKIGLVTDDICSLPEELIQILN